MKKLIIFNILLNSFLCFSSDLESAFNNVYEEAIWGKDESGFGTSGSGSTPESCIYYVDFVSDFIKTKNIKTILEIGCGDGVVLSCLNLDESISYIGLDLVEKILEKNKIKFPQYTFLKKDIVTDEIPFVDLILCKDVLQHLPNEYISLALKKVASHCKYALFTNDIKIGENNQKTNQDLKYSDIKKGFHRTINLKAPPFNQRGKEIFKYTSPNGEIKSIFLIKNNIQSNNL